MDILIVPEGILIPRIAGPQDHDLRILIQHLLEDRIDQIQSLLVRQPGDQPQHILTVVDLQPQPLLQGPLVLLLLLDDVVLVILRRQQRIRPRIPDLHIDAVHNAPQLRPVIPQMPVQPLPVEVRLNLLGIGRAHRRHAVRVRQPALEHVRFIRPLQEHGIIEQVIRQPAPVFQVLHAADSLEPQVVDCQDAPRRAHRRPRKVRPQIHRRQRRLPVMAVHHVRDPVQIIQHRQRRL